MMTINRAIKVTTLDNGYLMEFHEMKASGMEQPQEQHHVRSYKTLDELDADLQRMLSPIQLASGDIKRLN